MPPINNKKKSALRVVQPDDPSAQKQLWHRETVIFQLEVKVGNVWVEDGRYETYPRAHAELKQRLADRAVRAARVNEVELIQTCKTLEEEEQKFDAKVPPGMRDTGEMQPCPVCKTPAPVGDDGTFRWTVCDLCKRTSPVN